MSAAKVAWSEVCPACKGAPGQGHRYDETCREEPPAAYVAALEDPLTGANCSLCGETADNFHVPDDLWERVGLGNVQACFKCFRIAAWHAGVRPDPSWEVRLAA